jgi:hypothetical protein
VPLSEHEQRLLDQIERALYAEDPKFATTVRSTDLRTHMRRRMRRAGVLFVLGFVAMLAGIANLVVGVVGFVVMLGAMLLAFNAWKRMNGSGPALRSVDGPARQRKPRSRGTSSGRTGGSSVKARLEERWRKRWEERGGPQ